MRSVSVSVTDMTIVTCETVDEGGRGRVKRVEKGEDDCRGQRK